MRSQIYTNEQISIYESYGSYLIDLSFFFQFIIVFNLYTLTIWKKYCKIISNIINNI